MKTDNIYVTKIFVPTEFSLTTETGVVWTKLCKKENDLYIDLESKASYYEHDETGYIIGYIRVIEAVPLSEYYYKLGLKRKNNHDNKEEVHNLVKKAKTRKRI